MSPSKSIACLMFVLTSFGSAMAEDTSASSVLYSLDFSDQTDGPARQWLINHGFHLRQTLTYRNGFNDSRKIRLYFDNGRLYFDTVRPSFGIAIKTQTIGKSSLVRITWGVDRFPVGATYAKGVNDEAVMLYVYFGTERLASGSVFLPDSPYFIGLYPTALDEVGKAYLGHYYRRGGRFACVASPKTGEEVVSEYDLAENFMRLFKKTSVPPVSGFALEVDTSESGGGGRARAFIKKIEFLK